MKEMEDNGASFEQIRAVADKMPKSTNDDYVMCQYCGRKFN